MIKTKEQGITLLALIITIIVLVILAGVALNVLTGENGLITQSQRIVEVYNKEAAKENAGIALMDLRLQMQGNMATGTMAEYVRDAADGVQLGNGTIYEESGEYYFLDNEDILVELTNNNGTLTVGEVLGKDDSIVKKTLTYNANGGTGDVPGTSTRRSGKTVEVDLSTVPTREGYGFVGWATSSTATTAEYTADGTTSFIMPEEDVTLYAVWDANKHTLVYSVNGGDEGTGPTAEAVSYGQVVNIDLTTIPTRTGYRFLGYADADNAQDATYKTGGTTSITIPNNDVTIYAVWDRVYRIIYNANEGSGSMEPTIGKPAVVAANSFTAPSGYTFKEWNTLANGTGTPYAVGTQLNEDINLYAIWESLSGTVTYNANGGDANSVPAVQTVQYGTTANVNFNTIPTRSNYAFVGWTDVEGGTTAKYTSTGTTSFIMPNNNVTLYAIWEAIAIATTSEQLQEGDWVLYDTGVTSVGTNGVISCRVLYNDSTCGLQIISMQSVQDVTLGGSTFSTALTSYDEAIEILNGTKQQNGSIVGAMKYLNTYYAYDTRCVGSYPNVKTDGTFENKNKGVAGPVRYDYKSKNFYVKDTDQNYLTDYNKMSSLGTSLEDIRNIGTTYWLASRLVLQSNYCTFNVRDVSSWGYCNEWSLCKEWSDGDQTGSSAVLGLRPCFSLKTNLRITGGTGADEEHAYTLGI